MEEGGETKIITNETNTLARLGKCFCHMCMEFEIIFQLFEILFSKF